MICALSLRMIWLCSAKRSLEISLSLSLSLSLSRQNKLKVWPRLGRDLLIDVALLLFC